MEEPPPVGKLLKKIQELEASHAYLKQQMFKLLIAGDPNLGPQRRQDDVGLGRGGGHRRSHSVSPPRPRRESQSSKTFTAASGGCGPAAVEFSDRQYLNILQSMGRSVHIFDLNCRIIYW